MADLCVSVLVVLGLAWVVRRGMAGPVPQPLTAVRRRQWVFLSLVVSLVVHGGLAGLDLIDWRATFVPAVLLGVWLVLCRLMVRPRDEGHTVRQPFVISRLSPATLALVGASILALWIAVNPTGEHRNEAAAAPSSARASTSTAPVAVVAPAAPPASRATPTTAATEPTRQPAGAGTVMATRGAIVLVGDNARLTANTGETSSSGAVALGVEGSDLRAGDSGDVAAARRGAATPTRRSAAASNARTTEPTIGHENATLATLTKGSKGKRGAALSGFEDHSVSVVGDDQIITYDDSNVFIDRKGQINANTGDTDSSGLNAVDVAGSTVRAGNSGDSEGVEAEETPAEQVAEEAASPATSMDENRLSAARVAPPAAQDPDDAEENEGGEPAVGPAAGQAYGTVTDEGASIATGKSSFVVGADGYDDVSIRSHGRNDIVTYDDSNVTIGGEGKVNAQIGDSDTGGAVLMGIHNSDARAGCEGDLCYSATPTVQIVLELLRSAGVKLTPAQWGQLVDHVNSKSARKPAPGR